MGSAAVGLVVNSVGGYESVDFLRPRFDFFEDNFSSVSGPLIVLKKGSSKLRSPSLGPLVYWTSVVSMPSESGFSGSPASPPLRFVLGISSLFAFRSFSLRTYCSTVVS